VLPELASSGRSRRVLPSSTRRRPPSHHRIVVQRAAPCQAKSATTFLWVVASPDDSISARNRHAGESRHPDGLLVALLLDSGFRRNDESKATSELSGKPTCRFAWRRPSLAGCVASSASTLIVRGSRPARPLRSVRCLDDRS
jgi:hypothetical protein